jgi:hypothetical protein
MSLDDAILATIAYHDIFDYPLRAEEISNLLIGKKAAQKSVESKLKFLQKSKKIQSKANLYFLKGREKVCTVRKTREKYSNGKLKRALLYSRLLETIPTVKLVAVSGALAMHNSHAYDDIDLVIITQSKTLWTTRFFSNLILFPFKRRPKSKNTSDKACLNLFLDDSSLKLKNHNIYQAHELCQMKILCDKEKTYSKLIKSNLWVYKFLPNWHANFSRKKAKNKWNLVIPQILESWLKSFQLVYMKQKVTTEKIGERQLFFHPADTENYVINTYNKNLKKLKIKQV